MLILKRLSLTLLFALFAQSQLHAAINILEHGAKGDCVTNDAPVINALIRSIAFQDGPIHSGAIYFPAPPGGCYRVNEPILLPSQPDESYNIVISLIGDGRGVSIIKAGAAMDSVLEKDANWNQGDSITDLTFDANGVAKHAISLLGGIELRLTRVEGLNATVDDLHMGGVANHGAGESFITDSFFANYITFPPYNIYVDVQSTDNEFTNNIEINAKTANIEETGGSNHFTSNHAYGWPLQYCPTYSFVTAFTSIWVGNQSDCSSEAAFLVNSWNTMVESNFIQGAANHAICVSPQVGGNVITGNTALFNNQNEPASDAVVQGVMAGNQVSCKGPGVHTATWGNDLNFGISNIVQNNWPTSNENIWSALYTADVNQTPAIGIGTTTPQATLDINGFARLNTNASEPTACVASNKGAIALNSASHLCICDGASWKLDSSGQQCRW